MWGTSQKKCQKSNTSWSFYQEKEELGKAHLRLIWLMALVQIMINKWVSEVIPILPVLLKLILAYHSVRIPVCSNICLSHSGLCKPNFWFDCAFDCQSLIIKIWSISFSLSFSLAARNIFLTTHNEIFNHCLYYFDKFRRIKLQFMLWSWY